jgi:exodeoxyribonuclease-3
VDGSPRAYAGARITAEEMVVLAGDYASSPSDRRAIEHWVEDALYQPETRARYRRLLNLGLTCAFRACSSEPGHYTFWDYQAGAWQRNNGIRIDHQLLTPWPPTGCGAQIDKHPGWTSRRTTPVISISTSDVVRAFAHR